MWARFTAIMLLGATATTMAGEARGQAIGAGDGEYSATLLGTTIKVFTYRPADCTPRGLTLVFHGSERDAGPYRNVARPLASKTCTVIVSPLFDGKRFPDSAYQLGGVTSGGNYIASGSRPVDMVEPLIAWSRTASGHADLPVTLFAHSAGAQYVGRVAAFSSTAGARIVLVNPSTWVLPSATVSVPYGFGGRGTLIEREQAIRAYLVLPITVLLGTADTGTFNLAMDPDAMAQGPNRLTRGRNTYFAAEAMARERSWTFGWRKIEAPGAGHREMEMFNRPEAVEALK